MSLAVGQRESTTLTAVGIIMIMIITIFVVVGENILKVVSSVR